MQRGTCFWSYTTGAVSFGGHDNFMRYLPLYDTLFCERAEIAGRYNSKKLLQPSDIIASTSEGE